LGYLVCFIEENGVGGFIEETLLFYDVPPGSARITDVTPDPTR